MSLAYNRGDFVDSDKHCPECGKRYNVEATVGDVVLACLNCGNTELDTRSMPVNIPDVVRAVQTSRGVEHKVQECTECSAYVIEAVTIAHGKRILVDAEPSDGGSYLLFARPNLPPHASSLPIPKRLSRTNLRRAHVGTCSARWSS